MAIRVSPTEPNPTHDISLSDGSTTIGLHLVNGRGERDRKAIRQSSTPRTSLQIQQGDPTYSGYNLPYTPITQKNWSGGRGQADFNKDSTKYFDANGMNIILGDMILGPLHTLTTGYTNPATRGAAADGSLAIAQGDYVGSQYNPVSSIVMRNVTVKLRTTNASPGAATVHLFSDGPPGTPGASFAQQPVDVSGQAFTNYEVTFVASLTGGTAYWIMVEAVTSNIEIARDTSETGYQIQSINSGLLFNNQSIFYQVQDTGNGKAKYFEYRGSLMAVLLPSDESAPRLFMNGYRGFARTSNSDDKRQLRTSLNLAGVDLTGCTVKIIAGPGFADDPNYRVIVSNTATGTNDSIRVSPNWGTTHTTATEFVVQGVNTWQEITGHGLTGPVTDVLDVDDLVYFAQGDTNNIRKARLSAGTWSWDAEGNIDATYKGATFLKLIPETNGTSKIWAAQASTSRVYSADPITAWPTDLTFTQKNNSKPVGNPSRKITNMVAYDSPRVPYIFKEDGFGAIQNGIYAQIPNAELEAMLSENNGRAACVFGVYLFFSWLDGFERYYDQHLDDIGPNRSEGLPETRQGPVYKALPYPGGVVVAVNAGTSGYSSIHFWNSETGGWCELYRGALGERITDLYLQPIDGVAYSRLWFNEEQALQWIPMAANPRKANGYPFRSSATLITSWVKTSLGEINKFWRDVMLFTENLLAGNREVLIEYQTDDPADDAIWNGSMIFQTSPMDQEMIGGNYDVTGKRIRLRYTLSTNSQTETPRVIASTINAVTRVPPARTWGLTFAADDMDVQEGEGDMDALDMDGLLAQLELWANSETRGSPITMRSLIPRYDNKRVFIDSPNVQIREVEVDGDIRTIKSIGNLSVYEA